MTDWLPDSNIWLRSSELAHPMFAPATTAVRTITARGDGVHLVPQVVTEYWRVVTSPGSARGGFGWTPAMADAEIRRLETLYPVIRDTPVIFDWWRTLVVGVGALGASVYDARIAAVMLVHGWTHILTFNVTDFTRFAPWGIIPVHPNDV